MTRCVAAPQYRGANRAPPDPPVWRRCARRDDHARMIDAPDRSFLTRLFEAAVAAGDPGAAVQRNLPEAPAGRTVVVGAGKAAARMAAALEGVWPAPLTGVVAVPYSHGAPCRSVRVIEAAHPVPDAAGLTAARALIAAVRGLGDDDLVIALISGGGSALLPAPPAGLTLADEAALTEALLSSGAPIQVLNAIRRRTSRIKGGRLAAMAHPTRVVSLIVSDVPGDDPAEIASGPTVPAATGAPADAVALARDHAIALPARIRAHLDAAGDDAPRPGDPAFARDSVHVVASAGRSLEAAARAAREGDVPAAILSEAITGEAREAGHLHGAIAAEIARRHRPLIPPVVLLSGGEVTVTGAPAGATGGPNTEFLLAAALTIAGAGRITALAADTDGTDGAAGAAGAIADADTAGHLRAAGLDPAALLRGHDSARAFAAIEGLVASGPTGTNVNDFRAFLIRPRE